MEPAYVRIENLNLSNAKNEEFDVYAEGKLKSWIKMEWRDDNLWEVFQEDFGYFDEANFEKIDKPILRKIRDYLRANGVFVQKQQRYKIAKALAEIATEENPSVWPQEEIKEQMEKGGAFNSYRANKPSIFEPSFSGAKQVTVENETPTYSDFKNDRTNIVAQNTNISSKRSDLTDFGKNYTSDMKYGGNDDRFDYKLSIFYDICNRTNLPDYQWKAAIPIMLKDNALSYYYRTLLPKITPEISFENVIHSIKSNFEGEAYQRLVKQKWRKVNMKSMIADAPEKSLSEILETMIQKLQDLQLGLAPKYRDDDYLRDKLIEACEGIAAFQNACYRPAQSLEEFINDLRSSVLAHEKSIESTSSAFFTDRRFHKRNEGLGSHKNTARNTNTWNKNSQERSQDKKKCFICKQENCWSTKHSKKEREDYRYNLLRNVNNRVNQYLSQSNDDNYNEVTDKNNEKKETLDDKIEALISLSDELDLNASDSESFLTSFGQVDGLKMISTLSNNVTFHATTKDSLQSQEDPFSYATNNTATCFINRYNRDTFYGILIDTGASLRSTAGYEQYVAYKNLQNNFDAKITLDKTKAGVVNVQFGIGSTSSIGSITINTPIGVIEFHVVEADIPFLLSLNDMDRLQVKLDNLNNVLIQRGKEFPVTRRFGHVFLLDEITFKSSDCFLSEQELRQLHRRFGHPSANRLYNLLHQSNHKVHREAIERLNKFCLICQKNGQSPRRFKFSLHDDSIDFNHCIYIDIMYIDSKPVLHVVDEATRFQAARWLANMSTQSTWDALRLCWIDVYVGPPDCITHDAGSNFTSQEFQQYASSMAISTKCVPVEAHHSMGIVERYHAPLRRAYQVIIEDLIAISKEVALQMAVKSVNDTAGPNGLVPTLLVFGCYPRMDKLDPPAPSIAQRAKVIQKAMSEVIKLRNSRQITEALRQRNGPNTILSRNLAINSEVLVWRERNQKWEGPFRLLAVERETCKVQLPSGTTDFRITSVKPYIQKVPTHEQLSAGPEEPSALSNSRRRNPDRHRRLPLRFRDTDDQSALITFVSDVSSTNLMIRPAWTSQILEARFKELNDLIEKQVFRVVDRSEIPKNIRIFGSKWVDTIKNKGTTKAFAKARLVVQAFNDGEKWQILTQSPTIQRASQRLLLSIAASFVEENTGLYIRDISQAYVQSKTKINRDFYVRPPRELGLDDKLLKIEKPLYGIPEAGNHWFQTYHRHHIESLHMEPSAHDSCLLHVNTNHGGFGLIGLQTDDTLILADDKFAEEEEKRMVFLSKPRERLSFNNPLTFNGGIIELQKDTGKEALIQLTQEQQCHKIVPLSTEHAANKDAYIAQRARGAYIATVCQPEASFDLSSAAQIINPQLNDVKILNRRLHWQRENAKRGLKFVKLDPESLKVVVFTDGSFANNRDYSSQIGFVVVVSDKLNKANIIHWQSVKCKRVTRSVLASELYGMSLGFDHALSIKITLDSIMKRNHPLIVCTDSRSLFDCLVKLGTTHEKRLMIDIMCLRESYEKREITEVRWISGKNNPADSMTKSHPCDALRLLIENNEINIDAMEWVEREI